MYTHSGQAYRRRRQTTGSRGLYWMQRQKTWTANRGSLHLDEAAWRAIIAGDKAENNHLFGGGGYGRLRPIAAVPALPGPPATSGRVWCMRLERIRGQGIGGGDAAAVHLPGPRRGPACTLFPCGRWRQILAIKLYESQGLYRRAFCAMTSR